MARITAAVIGLVVLCTGEVGLCGDSGTEPVVSACAALKTRIANIERIPESGPSGAGWSGWFCDVSAQNPEGYFVFALRSNRPQPYSNLMGWYAVQRQDYAVFEWDIDAQKPVPLHEKD